MNVFLFLLNHSGSGTIDLWFTTSVGAGTNAILVTSTGVPACVLDIFCFGCPTDSTSLNSLSSSSLPILLAFDFISGSSYSSDFSWYSNHSSLM